MSTRILILKDGVLKPASSVDILRVSSADTLTTPRTINGVSFDGSQNIIINAIDSTARIASSEKGIANGVVPLNSSALIDAQFLPSYVDDVLEYSSLSAFPNSGETGKLYIAIDTNLVYRWTGSVYGVTSASLALGTTSTTAFRGDYGNTAYTHSQITSGNPHGVTAATINLGNLTNVAQVDLSNNQTIGGIKTFSSPFILSSTSGTSIGGFWRNVDNLEYKDSTNTTRVLLNSAGNLSNLGSRQTALNNISGGVTTGNYLRGDGTNIVLSTIQVGDVPTLNQNTTGTASNVTGTVAIGNGGTSATTRQAAINALVGTQTANRILRSDGTNSTLSQVALDTDVLNILPIANGGTGSNTKNFVDLTTDQTVAGIKTYTSRINMQSTTPGFWLDETDGGVKGAYVVLDNGFVQIQRRSTAFGAFEGTMAQVNILTGVMSLPINVVSTSTTTGTFICGGGAGFNGAIYALTLNLSSLPTSASGLSAGAVWRNGNILNIV